MLLLWKREGICTLRDLLPLTAEDYARLKTPVGIQLRIRKRIMLYQQQQQAQQIK